MSFVVLDKKTLEIVTDYSVLEGNEKNFLFIERPYSSLTHIWNTYKKPFIAKNEEGYFVLIENDLNAQKEKYHNNIYGKMDMSLSRLITKTRSQKIYDFGKWTFITLYN